MVPHWRRKSWLGMFPTMPAGQREGSASADDAQAAFSDGVPSLRDAGREHDRLLVRELALPDRYRRLLGGLQANRAEERSLHNDHLAAPD